MSLNLQTTVPSTLVTTQDLTASYANLGTEIDCRHYNKIGVWIKADVNTSEDVLLKALGKHTKDHTDEFEIDGLSIITLWSGVAADFDKYYEFETGAINYLQLQVIAGTLGTAGNLSVEITKVNN